jgi:hypothetical protein
LLKYFKIEPVGSTVWMETEINIGLDSYENTLDLRIEIKNRKIDPNNK